MSNSKEISDETVKNTAHLARIELRPGDGEMFKTQLSGILGYVDLLQNLDTDGIDPAFTVNPDIKNILGDDELSPGLSCHDALINAPRKENGYFRVPRIINREPAE